MKLVLSKSQTEEVMPSKRETYTITLRRPDGVTVRCMVYYIEEAVRCWSGGGEPEDPLFGAFHGKDFPRVRKVYHRRKSS
jgi:hypothetical protein